MEMNSLLNILEKNGEQKSTNSDPLLDKIENASGLITQFTEFNGVVQVSQIDPNSTTDSLRPGAYTLRISMQGFYLEVDHLPTLPPELYGNTEDRANLIINTYKQRDVSTGVLAIGKKGSGKTLLTNVITHKLIADGVPVIYIPQGFAGPAFNSFLSQLGDCCLIFDEFAKLYDNNKENQNQLLTLFDGTKSTKRLILLTENDEYNINSFLLGRPGRILYKFKYGNIDLDIVEEVLAKHNIINETRSQILHYSTDIHDMSMDILKALIDEHKRYPETDIKDIVERLNVTTSSEFTKYEFIPDKFELSQKGKDAGVDEWKFNQENQHLYLSNKQAKDRSFKWYGSKTEDNGEPNPDYEPNYQYNILEHEHLAVYQIRKDKPRAVKDGKYLYLNEYGSLTGEWKEIKPVFNYGLF